MKLRGIDFGCVFVASGTLNFFGEGWPHHKFLRLMPGFNFRGTTFVSKTTTLGHRKGNLELDMNFQPISLFPDCIRVYPVKGVVLNSVGLSGPGARRLFAMGLWQRRVEPFLISFMATDASKEDRKVEAKQFAKILYNKLPGFSTKIGLELNISCPNTTHDPSILINEAIGQLEKFVFLNIPRVVKVNALTPIEAISKIEKSRLCDAITVSNTIPWGQLPDKIDWKGIFSRIESPLKHLGGGGLSGYPLLPIVADWIRRARESGIKLPIIGGGGILKKQDVDLLHHAGADAVMLGSVAILRPWRVKGIINHAMKIYGAKQ